MAGIDPETKQYVGAGGRDQETDRPGPGRQADPAKDKKDTVDQLNASMATIPKLQFPGNIDIVVKNYDKLNEAMPQD